ncbi:MAG: sulfatase [Planctomycetes bacterium]|nr:sulfatase [Planctomycetota bacterium]
MGDIAQAIGRRTFLRRAGAASAAVFAAAPGGAGRGSEGPDRPNILWITAEDINPQLGCYGDPYARTPNLDRLAAEGVRYTNAFATAPVCSPARSCLITGIYATSLGTQNLRSRFPIPSFLRGFPTFLREAGYYTTNNVKTDYNTSAEPEIIAASWDESSAKAHWRGRKPGQPFFAVFNDMVSHQSRASVFPYEKFLEDVQSKLAPEERHDPAKAPVPPYYPDTPTVRRTIARYYDCITAMDENAGDLLRELEADGLADDTIVLFYGDNGAGLPRHKRLVLDSGLRVPLIIRFPEKYRHLAPAAPGEATDRLVSFVDFPPAMLSLLGIRVPSYMQGEPFLGPAAAGRAPRTHIYGARDRVDEAYDLARSIRDGRYLYARNFMPHLSYNQPEFYSDQSEIRPEITRLAAEGKLSGAALDYASPTRAIEELYDTAADPYQVRNLAGSPAHAAVLERMRAALRAWILWTRDLGFLPEADMAARSAGTTPYAMGKDDKAYPIERITAAADLVGRGSASRPEQVRLLGDPDPAVRYWAAVGLHALGSDAAPAAEALARALGDPAPVVRVEAAAALCGIGRAAEGLPILEKTLLGDDRRVALRAARALELLGPIARPALPAMRKAFEGVRGAPGDEAMFLRFALEPAIGRLGG